jgi:predicted dehydrogenase
MSEIRIGIVGLGWVAGAHIEAFRQVEGARVAAVCSRRPQDQAALERRFGLPLKACQDYQAMLADPDLDVIDICTPHPLHPEQAIAAARAGKHLIIEKPLATTWESAKALRDAVLGSGVRVCVCFECRFSKHFSLIRSVIEEGLLGDLHYAEVDYYHGIGPWYGQFGWNIRKDMGGSSLLTAGCHALDGLLFFKDSPVVEVVSHSNRSSSETFQPYEYDTTSVTLLKFADGSLGKVASVIDCHQPYYFHIHLVGSHGSLLDNRLYSTRLAGLSKERWSTLETSLIDSGDVKDHPYLPQFQAFVNSLRRGENMPRTDFATAWETHRVVFAADRSAAEGRPVRLEELV